MSKVSAEAKKRYAEKIKEYKQKIESLQEKAKGLLFVIKTNQNGVNYKKLNLANNNLNILSYYILMNELSESLLGIKNDAFLNEARKSYYKSLIYLEEILGTGVDVPFSDYEDRLETISAFDDKSRYKLVTKLGFSLDSVEESFGENSKWKWSFVELEGRYAAVTKNLIDMKTFIGKMDPRIDGYTERMAHLNLAKKLLSRAADRYREKYELSTHHFDDMKRAIRYLGALRRMHIILSESAQMDVIKRKMEIWKNKMESDIKKAELAARKERLSRNRIKK